MESPPDDDSPQPGDAASVPRALSVATLSADPTQPIRQFLDQCDGYNLADVAEGIFTLGPELLAMIGVYSRQMGIRRSNTHTDIRVHWGNGVALRADFIPVHAIKLTGNKGGGISRR